MTIDEQKEQDLMFSRRLQVGCGIHGHWYGMLKTEAARQSHTAPCRQSVKDGYYNAKTGTYQNTMC